MLLLQANQVARYFGADALFENIQLEVSNNSRIGLVGRNGAGKSTLLKIIAGIDAPDAGNITKTKGTTMGYLAQDTGLASEDTVWQEMLKAFEKVRQMEARMRELEIIISESTPEGNQYESVLKEYDRLQHDFADLNGYGYENEIRSVLHGFSFDESFYQQPIDTLSGGQKTRLALAKLLLLRPDILILDEPTNHLDIETLSWLENYLQGYTGALLIVSHDRYFLDKVVNEIYELSRHKLRNYKGNYSRYLDLKAEQLASEWKAYEKQQTEIAKLEDFVARNLVRASTTKRAQSRRKKLEKMDRMDRPEGDEKSVHFLFDIEKVSGNVVLQLEDAAIGYDDTILSSPVNLDIRKQEAVALVGPNGIGKSTLLKSLVGKIPFVKGEPHFGTNVTIGYYDQGQADLHSTKTVLAELWDEHPTTPEKDIRTVLGGFLFSGSDVEKTIPLLSGGEKARVALAKLSMDRENFLILDEPTNHLDIDNKEVLENSLIDYEGTIFFVSHDRYFINRIATKVVELSEAGSKVYLGDYDYYLEKKREEAELAAIAEDELQAKHPTPEVEQKNQFLLDKEQQKLQRNLTRKIQQAEEDLAKLDAAIANLQEEMNAPQYVDDHTQLMTLNQELEVLLVEQEEKLSEWETLSIELEEM